MLSANAVVVLLAAIAAIAPIIVALRGINQKTDQIHGLVNSNLSEVKADLATANAQIKVLLEQQANDERRPEVKK